MDVVVVVVGFYIIIFIITRAFCVFKALFILINYVYCCLF